MNNVIYRCKAGALLLGSTVGRAYGERGGFGLSDYLSTTIIPTRQWPNGDYHHWTTNSTLIGADGGGNISAGYTFVPFTW